MTIRLPAPKTSWLARLNVGDLWYMGQHDRREGRVNHVGERGTVLANPGPEGGVVVEVWPGHGHGRREEEWSGRIVVRRG